MKHNIICAIILGVIYSSCTPVYVPNTRNMPDLDEQGQFKATAMFSTSGLELNTNFMVTDQVGLMLNGSFAEESGSAKSHQHKFLEVGVGFHQYFDKINLSIYGGHGFGSARSEDLDIASNPIFAEGDFQRTFFQPTVAFNTGVFVPSLAIRISRVHFPEYLDQGLISPAARSEYFFEPAIQMGFNFDPLELDIQSGFIHPFSDEGLEFDYRISHVAIGLAYRF